MNRPVKVLTILLWIVAVTGMFSVVALKLWTPDRQSQADVPRPLPIFAPAFSLVDQLGRPVTTADLKGHPWIADFIFTECTSACPLMTHHLAGVQKTISPQVKFISFSVDPAHDTPAVLLAYSNQNGADNDRWRFLTGDKKEIFAAIAGMKVAIVPATQPTDQIEHDIHYMLVDSTGQVRGIYDSRTPAEIDRLVREANALAPETVQ